MIICKIMGGLGNQMFQYALGRHLSIINQAEYKLDISCYDGNIADPMQGIRVYGLNHFNIKAAIASKPDLAEFNTTTNNKVLKKLIYLYRRLKFSPGEKYLLETEKNYFKFNPSVLRMNISDKKFYLKGYWQSEKYFKDIANIIRDDFKFINEPDEINKKILNDIQNSNSISIHVRHGDNANNVVPWHGVLSLKYYHQAINRLMPMVKNPIFYIFSDDPEWVRNNLKLIYPTVYISHNGDEKNYEDLRLMSYCQHHIVGNSTFSWWGAWLGNKTGQKIFAPKCYYQNYHLPTTDLYPENWIKL